MDVIPVRAATLEPVKMAVAIKPLNGQQKPKYKGHFLEALRAKDHTELHKMGAEMVSKASAQGESSGVLGSYVVPLDFNLSFMRTYEENTFIYPRAFVVDMESRETMCPKFAAETPQAAGQSPFFAGMKMFWGQRNTGNNPVGPNPTFDQISLVAKDLTGYLTVSNQFAADIGTGGDEKLLELFARCTAWHEEYAYLNGLGGAADQPWGILTGPGKIYVPRQAPNQISALDVENMVGTMMPLSWNHAIWACSPTALAQVTGITGFIPNQSGYLGEMCAGFLMSRPLYVSEKVPALGTPGDLSFIDPSMYAIGDRQELVIAISEENRFPNYQTVYRLWRRVDGMAILDGAITLADGTSTASPFVILQ